MGLCILRAADFGGEVISIEVIQTPDLPEEDELIEVVTELEVMPEPAPLEEIPDEVWVDESADEMSDLVSNDLAEGLGALAEMASATSAFPTKRRSGGGTAQPGLAARARRRQQALSYGATLESEQAVEAALEWLARHQRTDGSWCFDHRSGVHACKPCRCGNPGGHSAALNGATALALLPFLGAGHTHWEGEYQQNVARGLRYLISHQKQTGSFHENGGRMYSHGLATLALTEAYAMTRFDNGNYDFISEDDPQSQPGGRVVSINPTELREAAQRAIVFTEAAQHKAGGWRYEPNQPGDTSVVGWQMMALKSGDLAGLKIAPDTIKKGIVFLDAVQEDRIGSAYGYTGGQKRANLSMGSAVRATTPIGLLCRMYTGWDRDRQGIKIGVIRLESSARPNQGMYFYYYATQVMHHYRGNAWEKWNGWMRDHLVDRQSHKGSTAGSWQLKGNFDNSGRLYCTAMAAMTLEVYYRHSPVYGYEATETVMVGTEESDRE
jgi:hypothetical protein